jgi:hypothetical protein
VLRATAHILAHVDKGACVHEGRIVQDEKPELEACVGERILGCLIEGEHLHDAIGPLRRRQVALRRPLPESMVRYLDAHDKRKPENHAKHMERIRVHPYLLVSHKAPIEALHQASCGRTEHRLQKASGQD